MIGGGPAIALHDVPHVAEVVKRIYDRPFWQHGEPLEVDPDLYERAQTEFRHVLENRGWGLQTAPLDRANFLLRGVPIVMGE